MIGLILKDLLFIKNSWKNLLVTYISSIILSVVLNNYLPAIYLLPIMLSSMGINAFQTDEFYLTESFSLTFPISRKRIVLSRYMFTFLMMYISFIIGILTYFIIYILNPTGLSISIIGNLFILIYICTMTNIIIYPLIYKYGCEKSKYVLTSIVMVILSLLALLLNIIDISNIDFNNIINYLSNYGFFIILILTIIIVYISYKLSCKFFSRNDY